MKLFTPLYRALVLVALAAVLCACSSLPGRVDRAPSSAITDYAATPLAALTQPVLKDDGRSGFRLLPDGASAYATRIELTRLATRSLDVQYYLLLGDDAGRYLMRALRDAAARGVRVRVLVDDLYTQGEDPLLLGLAAYPNVQVRLFNPFPGGRGSTLTRFISSGLEFNRVNRRMHNKLFVADNAVAVAGGRNMANEYVMNASESNFVDLDTFIAGPVVRDLSNVFDRYWSSEHVFPVGAIVPSSLPPEQLRQQFETLTADAVPPRHVEIPAVGAVVIAAPDSKPVQVSDDLRSMINLPFELAKRELKPLLLANARVLADPLTKTAGLNEDNLTLEGTVLGGVLEWFTTARKNVTMVSPYLVPGPGGIAAMHEAHKAGIELHVVTNSLAASDEPWVHVGYARYRKDMLKMGVRIEELSPTLSAKRSRMGLFGRSRGALHAKIAILDRKQVFLGSLNLDQRSATLNTELGLIIDSPELADQIFGLVDHASAYTVRLGPDGESLEWVEQDEDENGNTRQAVVHHSEPETSAWLRFKLWLLGPLVPEKQL